MDYFSDSFALYLIALLNVVIDHGFCLVNSLFKCFCPPLLVEVIVLLNRMMKNLTWSVDVVNGL